MEEKQQQINTWCVEAIFGGKSFDADVEAKVNVGL